MFKVLWAGCPSQASYLKGQAGASYLLTPVWKGLWRSVNTERAERIFLWGFEGIKELRGQRDGEPIALFPK